jgi:hypothetical protein
LNELTPLERLKYSQHLFRQRWAGSGVSVEATGRPGTSTLCNKSRLFSQHPRQVHEERRSDLLMKVMAVLAGVEAETGVLTSDANIAEAGKTKLNFFGKKNGL